MNAFVDFVLPALFVSALALIALSLADRAPAPVRLAIAAIGLVAWVVPWPLIRAPAWSAADLASPEVWANSGEQLATLKGRIAATIESVAPAASEQSLLWLAMLVPGLVWLAADIIRYAGTIRRWERESHSGDHLRELLQPSLGARRLRIRIVDDSFDAVAAGLFRPTVYIGAALVRSDDLRIVLAHESSHIRRHDPLWLMLIWSIRRFYWFNPIVVALERQAVLAIEAACDEACVRMLGRSEYRLGLARLILGRAERKPLPAPGLSSSKLDLIRLAWLATGRRMDLRAWVAIVAAGAGSVGGVALAAADSPGSRNGDWIEIADASRYGYDISPSMLRFERLPGGFTRLYSNATPEGPGSWFDYRCDGREYSSSDAAGSTLSCVARDRWTNEYRLQGPDGTVTRIVETISRDGQSLASLASAGAAEGALKSFARVR